MRVVMRRTGLGADVLRAWERRYHAVTPVRSSGGQRLYSDADLDRLALLQRVTALGRGIGQVARLRDDELRRLLMEEEPEPAESGPSASDALARAMGREAMALIEALDGVELEKSLRRGALQIGVGPMIEGVLSPLMHEIGDRWHRGELTPAHEHLASSVVERILHWMREAPTDAADAPRIALATTQGERHELGIQFVAAIAAAEAWRVIYLGGDLPADSLVLATRQAEAQVLALSFVSRDGARQASATLREIRENLPPGVAVIAGGAGAVELRDEFTALGVSVPPNLEELRKFLRSYR